MPFTSASITATYIDNSILTVINGTGSGFYPPGTVVTITADAPPANKAFNKWTGDVAGLTNIYSSSFSLTMPDSNVTLTATYDTVIVMINAFSPNADGVNDAWNIPEMTDPDFIGDIKVYNRWGQLVYDFSASHQPWYGYDLKGCKLPIESYHYVIDYRNGIKKTVKGVITIVR
jgi:gliding motility-associated-like protein